jgi:hypothetical protein
MRSKQRPRSGKFVHVRIGIEMKSSVTVHHGGTTLMIQPGVILRDTKAALVAAHAQYDLALRELTSRMPDFHTRCTEAGVQPSFAIKVRYNFDTGHAIFAVCTAKPAAFRNALQEAYFNLTGDAEKTRACIAASLPLHFASHEKEIP